MNRCDPARRTLAHCPLAFDFLGDGAFHPVIELPEKQPLDDELSGRCGTGTLSIEIGAGVAGSGDEHARRMFEIMLASALATHESFLNPARDGHEKTMDRLHAYCYSWRLWYLSIRIIARVLRSITGLNVWRRGSARFRQSSNAPMWPPNSSA